MKVIANDVIEEVFIGLTCVCDAGGCLFVFISLRSWKRTLLGDVTVDVALLVCVPNF